MTQPQQPPPPAGRLARPRQLAREVVAELTDDDENTPDRKSVV